MHGAVGGARAPRAPGALRRSDVGGGGLWGEPSAMGGPMGGAWGGPMGGAWGGTTRG